MSALEGGEDMTPVPDWALRRDSEDDATPCGACEHPRFDHVITVETRLEIGEMGEMQCLRCGGCTWYEGDE
jgi:hypothetical protein